MSVLKSESGRSTWSPMGSANAMNVGRVNIPKTNSTANTWRFALEVRQRVSDTSDKATNIASSEFEKGRIWNI